MIYYTCVIIDEVEKTNLVYSPLPTGCGAGIPGHDERVCNLLMQFITGGYRCMLPYFVQK